MAYTCVLAPSHECDGCQECEQDQKPNKRWDSEYNSDDYAEYICGKEDNNDR